MNPMTNVKNIQKLNERMLDMGVADEVSWHKQYKDSAYVFIGGLPYDLTEGDILCVFSQYGEIVNINLVRDKKTGKQKGFCFLCYEDQRSTILAVDNFNGIKLGGRTIRVDHCADYRRPKSDEKDEDGKRKEIMEEGCAPKTPSPSPSEDEEHMEPVKKKKKSKKEKKHKKDKEQKDTKREYSSESDSDHHQHVKKHSGKDKRNNRNPSPTQGNKTAKDGYQKAKDNKDTRFDRTTEWDHGKNIKDNTRNSSPQKARKREYDKSYRTQPSRREWDEGKRNINENERGERKRNYEDKEYRSYDKKQSRYDRNEYHDKNDYKRSRKNEDYDRVGDRNERKGNRR